MYACFSEYNLVKMSIAFKGTYPGQPVAIKMSHTHKNTKLETSRNTSVCLYVKEFTQFFFNLLKPLLMLVLYLDQFFFYLYQKLEILEKSRR